MRDECGETDFEGILDDAFHSLVYDRLLLPAHKRVSTQVRLDVLGEIAVVFDEWASHLIESSI